MQIESFYANAFSPTKFGMHHGHHPEITLDGDKATGYGIYRIYLSTLKITQRFEVALYMRIVMRELIVIG